MGSQSPSPSFYSLGKKYLQNFRDCTLYHEMMQPHLTMQSKKRETKGKIISLTL